MLAPWKKSYNKSRQCIKQRHHFVDKGLYSQSYVFPHEQERSSTKELMLSKCGDGENSWESPGVQGDQSSQTEKKVSSEYSLERLMRKWNLQLGPLGILRKPDAWKD